MNNYELLLHPTIPQEVAKISPNTLESKEWWDKKRVESYQLNNDKCHACGIHKSNDPYHNWLEAHQVFKYNFEEKYIEYIGISALCHRCHRFIHIGLCSKIDDDNKFNDVMSYGLENLSKIGLSLYDWKKLKLDISKRLETVIGWRVLYDGNFYSYKDVCAEHGLRPKYSELNIEKYDNKIETWNIFKIKRKIWL